MESNSVRDNASDYQNRTTAKLESDLLITSATAAFIPLFFRMHSHFYSIIFAFFSFISLSWNQNSVRFFCIILFCLVHLYISITTFQCSRSN